MHRVIYLLNNNRLIRILVITGILLFPVIMFIVPLDWVRAQHSVCLFKLFTGHECIGCGMTRAVLSVIHFRFEDAFHYNKLVTIVFPLLIYIWLKTLFNFSKNQLTYSV
jgi:hypothetical protein